MKAKHLTRLVAATLASVVATSSNLSAGPFEQLYRTGHGSFTIDRVFGGDVEHQDTFFLLPIDMAVDANGNVFVLDARSKVIKRFDPSGMSVVTFSQSGSGPGDLNQPLTIDATTDGELLVYDQSLLRFTKFSNTGEFLGIQQMNEGGRPRFMQWRWTRGGESTPHSVRLTTGSRMLRRTSDCPASS